MNIDKNDKKEVALSLLEAQSSPQLYLSKISPDLKTANFVRMNSREDYLDLHWKRRPAVTVNLDMLTTILGDPPPERNPTKFIFMTDYCCSTLLTNLIGQIDGCFALAEPTVLPSLSIAKRLMDCVEIEEVDSMRWKRSLGIAISLLSRSYSPPETIVIKEGPLASYILGDILECGYESSAIFLYSGLREYLISVLKRERRRELMRNRVKDVFRELHVSKELDYGEVGSLEDHQLAVLHWITVHHNVSRVTKDRPDALIRSLNCELVLDRPQTTLCSVANHFDLAVDRAEISSIIDGSTYRTYSKKNDPVLSGSEYTVDHRTKDLEEAYRANCEEVDAGLEWGKRYVESCVENLPPPLGI